MIVPLSTLTRATTSDAMFAGRKSVSSTRSNSSSMPSAKSGASPKWCSTGVSLRTRCPIVCAAMSAKDTLIEELRRHALIVGEVTLTSGATAHYYVDAKRAILRPAGFAALAELVAGYAREWEATAVGGLTMGADAPACAALAGGADVKAFFVRKETKAHGLQRKIEGPPLAPGERCLIVEDGVTSGGSPPLVT